MKLSDLQDYSVVDTTTGGVSNNNNPLNIKHGGATSQYIDKYGASIGSTATDGGSFLRFKDSESGLQAGRDLLINSNVYKDLTVNDAMKKWSNSGYGGEIAPSLSGKKISELTPLEQDTLVHTMAGRENSKNAPLKLSSLSDYQVVDNSDQSLDINKVNPSSSLTDSPVGSIPGIKQATEFGVGLGSKLGELALNIPKSVLSASQGVADVGTKILGTPKQDYSGVISGIDTLSRNLYQKPFEKELDTISGKVGQVAGEIAPYMMGVGATTSKLSNVASGAKALQGSGLLPAVGRIAAGATTEGLANLGAGYVLSGGDAKQAKNQALISGALKAGFSTIGEIVNATGLGESLVGKIFKTNKAEVKKVFNGKGEDSLAKQVIDRGHYGNTEQLAEQFTSEMDNVENQLSKQFADSGNPKIILEEPQRFVQYIKDKAQLLRKGGATKAASGLEASLPSIDEATGEISANNALGLRRFLDGLRYEKSYLSQTEELGSQQAGLKEMSDEIRHKINQVGGGAIGKIMKDYTFYIKALDGLAKHATSEANNKGLSIINSFLLGEGIASANPYLTAAGIARKAASSVRGATTIANTLKNAPKSSATGSAARSSLSSQASKLISKK